MPITPTLQTHDILLTDYAGTPVTLGLILEKDEKGIPIFRRIPADSLSQQQFQDFSQAIFPPQYQGFITQKTWKGGFGKQEIPGIGNDNRYMQTHGVDCSISGLKYPAPVPVQTTKTGGSIGTIVKLIDFNSNHYAVSDAGVWKRTADDWALVASSPTPIVDAATDGTYLYLARGAASTSYYMATNETFTEVAGANSQIDRLLVIGSTIYGIVSNVTLRKFTSFTAGTIAANYTLKANATTTALVDHLTFPTAIQVDWAAYVNASGTVVEIANKLQGLSNANTGKNSISWQGETAQSLYIPAGAGASLIMWDDGLQDNIGPNKVAENLSDFTGQIVATAADDEWLYVVLDNSTKIEILKGRYETVDNVTVFRWHPIVEDTYTTVSYAHISSITAKRLYYGGGTALPKYIPLPSNYGAPLSDTNLTFNTAVTDESSWYDLNFPRSSKTYLNCTLDSTGLSATKTITVEYQLWESQGTWTELGGSGNGIFVTSPTQTKTFAINISGRKIRFRFTYTTDNTTVAYGMYQFTCRLALSPSRLNIFLATVKVGNKNYLLGGGELDKEMVYTKAAAQLHTWKDTQPLLLTYPDGQMDGPNGTHDGATVEVKFMEGYPKENPISLGQYKSVRVDPESLFELALISIDRSVS